MAGVTAYRALFSRAKLQKGENVLITGIGGGVALMAAQLAEAAGANVFFTTGSDDKLENALALGFKGESTTEMKIGWKILQRYAVI